MKITITDHAAEKINQYKIGKDGWLKLKYDAEECRSGFINGNNNHRTCQNKNR